MPDWELADWLQSCRFGSVTDERTFQQSPLRRSLAMLALVVSGEVIFILPFVLTRIFRPTYLDVFGLTNLELGTAFAILGTIAMIAYLQMLGTLVDFSVYEAEANYR